MAQRKLTPVDQFIAHIDSAVRTVFSEPVGSGRNNPARTFSDPGLSALDKAESTNLMRVNHAGEVSAQALYQGQALTARSKETRTQLEQAAREENDHLAWCHQRIEELDGHTSYLNPLFYAGSLLIGAASGLMGDKWSLGFLAETEHQVVNHLQGHLERLPDGDNKSRAILEQMKEDEAKHKTAALSAGGTELPAPVMKLMQLASRVMTTLAYRI